MYALARQIDQAGSCMDAAPSGQSSSRGSDCSPSPNMLSLRRPLQFVPTAVCILQSVLAPTLSDADQPLAAAAARGEQGRRLSAEVLAERPVVSWWRAVSAQQGRSAEQVTQGCVRPFPDTQVYCDMPEAKSIQNHWFPFVFDDFRAPRGVP